jgi:hypothetical protein
LQFQTTSPTPEPAPSHVPNMITRLSIKMPRRFTLRIPKNCLMAVPTRQFSATKQNKVKNQIYTSWVTQVSYFSSHFANKLYNFTMLPRNIGGASYIFIHPMDWFDPPIFATPRICGLGTDHSRMWRLSSLGCARSRSKDMIPTVASPHVGLVVTGRCCCITSTVDKITEQSSPSNVRYEC